MPVGANSLSLDAAASSSLLLDSTVQQPPAAARQLVTPQIRRPFRSSGLPRRMSNPSEHELVVQQPQQKPQRKEAVEHVDVVSTAGGLSAASSEGSSAVRGHLLFRARGSSLPPLGTAPRRSINSLILGCSSEIVEDPSMQESMQDGGTTSGGCAVGGSAVVGGDQGRAGAAPSLASSPALRFSQNLIDSGESERYSQLLNDSNDDGGDSPNDEARSNNIPTLSSPARRYSVSRVNSRNLGRRHTPYSPQGAPGPRGLPTPASSQPPASAPPHATHHQPSSQKRRSHYLRRGGSDGVVNGGSSTAGSSNKGRAAAAMGEGATSDSENSPARKRLKLEANQRTSSSTRPVPKFGGAGVGGSAAPAPGELGGRG